MKNQTGREVITLYYRTFAIAMLAMLAGGLAIGAMLGYIQAYINWTPAIECKAINQS